MIAREIAVARDRTNVAQADSLPGNQSYAFERICVESGCGLCAALFSSCILNRRRRKSPPAYTSTCVSFNDGAGEGGGEGVIDPSRRGSFSKRLPTDRLRSIAIDRVIMSARIAGEKSRIAKRVTSPNRDLLRVQKKKGKQKKRGPRAS